MRVVIDGSLIKNEADFHAYLARELDLPSYYGRNLDALWDILSGSVERPVEFVWKKSEVSRGLMGDDAFERIKAVLIKVADFDVRLGFTEKLTVSFE